MAEKLDLFLMGLSHRTASVQVREECSMTPEELGRRLETVLSLELVHEGFLISTCNRTEVLVAVPEGTESEAFHTSLREVVFRSAPRECIYAYRDVEAVMHLFRVSAGLDSLVMGESQILSQVKASIDLSRSRNGTGRLLEPLLQQALSTGKRVRNETAVGQGTLSVARAGVAIAAQVFGDFGDNAALVVGAGETGQLVAHHLKAHGIGRLTLANRTAGRAEEAAHLLGCYHAPVEDLAQLVPEVDVVVTCLEGAPGFLTLEHFPKKQVRQRDKPLVVVDLSVPRAVVAEVADLKNVLSYNLDDLAGMIDKNRQERLHAGEEAAPILLAEVHKFLSLRAYASYRPTIARLRRRFEAVREEELDFVAGDHTDAKMMRLAHRLTRHTLDVALDELKIQARDTIPPESLDQAYQRFLEEQ